MARKSHELLLLLLVLLNLFLSSVPCIVDVDGAEIEIDWSRGNLSLVATTQDVLLFRFDSQQHNLFAARTREEYDNCVGSLLCPSSCSISMIHFNEPEMYLFCNNHCEDGFKSILRLPENVIQTKSPTLTPTTMAPTAMFTAIPSQSPLKTGETRFPTKSPTFAPTRRPTKQFPTKSPTFTPTKRPTKRKRRTLPPSLIGSAEENARLAVFIQMDFSGSIREADPICRFDSEKDCWNVAVDMIDQLIARLTLEMKGWYNKLGFPRLRVHISYFTCSAKTNEPVNNVVTIPSIAHAPQHVDRAIRTLRTLNRRRMYGTCPSAGAKQVLHLMKKLKEWPKAYFIVTDGRVQQSDWNAYRNTMIKVRKLVHAEFAPRELCSMSVAGGDVAKRDFAKFFNSPVCTMAATSFAQLTSHTSHLVKSMLALEETNATRTPTFIRDDEDEEEDEEYEYENNNNNNNNGGESSWLAMLNPQLLTLSPVSSDDSDSILETASNSSGINFIHLVAGGSIAVATVTIFGLAMALVSSRRRQQREMRSALVVRQQLQVNHTST